MVLVGWFCWLPAAAFTLRFGWTGRSFAHCARITPGAGSPRRAVPAALGLLLRFATRRPRTTVTRHYFVGSAVVDGLLRLPLVWFVPLLRLPLLLPFYCLLRGSIYCSKTLVCGFYTVITVVPTPGYCCTGSPCRCWRCAALKAL
jgi:hypothetical protein